MYKKTKIAISLLFLLAAINKLHSSEQTKKIPTVNITVKSMLHGVPEVQVLVPVTGTIEQLKQKILEHRKEFNMESGSDMRLIHHGKQLEDDRRYTLTAMPMEGIAYDFTTTSSSWPFVITGAHYYRPWQKKPTGTLLSNWPTLDLELHPTLAGVPVAELKAKIDDYIARNNLAKNKYYVVPKLLHEFD